MIKYIWYSLFVQAFFNYHTMLSVGACYLLDKILDRKEIPKRIRLRLIIFFNGHPYLVPYAISAIAKEIEKGTDEKKIIHFIDSVVGFLGAVGDQYYWNSLKPLVLFLPVFTFFLGAENWLVILISILSFTMFNIIQLRERYKGIIFGKKLGFRVIAEIKKLKSSWVNHYLANIIFILVFTATILYFVNYYCDADLVLFCITAFIWGMIFGRRGNSKKYIILAIINFIILENIR